MSKKPDGPSKRGGDSKGQSRSVGKSADMDLDRVTEEVGTLAHLSNDKSGTWAADPYNKKLEQTVPKKRRSLDDMRRLSEAIKESSQWTRQSDTSAFFDRLAALRADLEFSLRIVEDLHEEALLCMSEQVIHDMAEQLRNAVDHVENALDELMPPKEQGGD